MNDFAEQIKWPDDPKWTWWAMDKNGRGYFYTEQPVIKKPFQIWGEVIPKEVVLDYYPPKTKIYWSFTATRRKEDKLIC